MILVIEGEPLSRLNRPSIRTVSMVVGRATGPVGSVPRSKAEEVAGQVIAAPFRAAAVGARGGGQALSKAFEAAARPSRVAEAAGKKPFASVDYIYLTKAQRAFRE